jgi:hypothetical protein
MKCCNFIKFSKVIGVTKKSKKKHELKSAMQISKNPHKNCNLKTFKMDKN